jgi:hypothetical protein
MSTAIAKLATNVGVSEVEITDVVKGMIVSAKGQHGSVASNAELTVVAGICATYGLNPLIREAHAFISGGKLQVTIGIDGWVKIMNRQPTFNGVEFIDNFEGKELVSITTKIHIKGRDFPTCVTEYMDECFQSKSAAWVKFKKRMLRNKSLGQGVRVAFGISEVIDDDEKGRIVDSTPKERDITPGPSVDLQAIEHEIAECGDLDTLKSVVIGIHDKMQNDGSWNTYKADIIALKSKYLSRIKLELANEEAEEAEQGEEKAIEGELLSEGDGTGSEAVSVEFGDEAGGEA